MAGLDQPVGAFAAKAGSYGTVQSGPFPDSADNKGTPKGNAAFALGENLSSRKPEIAECPSVAPRRARSLIALPLASRATLPLRALGRFWRAMGYLQTKVLAGHGLPANQGRSGIGWRGGLEKRDRLARRTPATRCPQGERCRSPRQIGLKERSDACEDG